MRPRLPSTSCCLALQEFPNQGQGPWFSKLGEPRPGLWGNQRKPTLSLGKGSPACGEKDVVEPGSQSEVQLAQPGLKKRAIFLAGWEGNRLALQSPEREGRRLRHRGRGPILREEARNSRKAGGVWGSSRDHDSSGLWAAWFTHSCAEPRNTAISKRPSASPTSSLCPWYLAQSRPGAVV